MSDYTAHLRVGVHVWDVASTDAPEHGPLAGLRFSWGARQDDGWPTQHDPTALVFGVIVEAGTDFDEVDQGTVVHFTFTPEGYVTPLVTFGGTVRDLTAYPHPRGMVYEITALDHLVKLAEDYTVSAFIPANDPTADLWPKIIADAGGAGGGEGIRPALTDPFTGTDGPLPNGFNGITAYTIAGSAWQVLVGYMGVFLDRAGVTVPRFQRPLLTYRLDGAGNLDAAQPFQARWTSQGAANAPLSLVEVSPGVYGSGEGNVSAAVLRTDATVWSRQRIEPNRVDYTDPTSLSVFTHVRTPPGTGVPVIRSTGGWWFEGNSTDAGWILAGEENPNQWGTEFALVAADAPELVAGWFTLPDAMRTAVACHGIDPRHTPDGSGAMFGMLAGAALVIPAGGRWEVRFTLRRTLPEWDDTYGLSDPGYGHWATPEAITIDQVAAAHPALTFDALDPALTINDTLLIGD